MYSESRAATHPEPAWLWARHPTAIPPARRLTPRQVLGHLRRQGLSLDLTGEMMGVSPRGRLSPVMRGHILVNLRGMLELLAREAGVLKPERPVTFERLTPYRQALPGLKRPYVLAGDEG